jgi:hypothetical protein
VPETLLGFCDAPIKAIRCGLKMRSSLWTSTGLLPNEDRLQLLQRRHPAGDYDLAVHDEGRRCENSAARDRFDVRHLLDPDLEAQLPRDRDRPIVQDLAVPAAWPEHLDDGHDPPLLREPPPFDPAFTGAN